MPRAKKAKTETLERIDLNEDFSDVDGDPNNEFVLPPDLSDSDRRYVWVHNDKDSISEYRNHVLKYEPVTGAKDAKGLSEVVTSRDHVLMGCDRARFEKRERFKRVQGIKQSAAFLNKKTMTGDVDLGAEGIRDYIQAELKRVTAVTQRNS